MGDALTDGPLEGVVASLSDGSNSQTGLTGSDGTVDIPITQNGEYGLIAELDNYVPQRQTVVVNWENTGTVRTLGITKLMFLCQCFQKTRTTRYRFF